MKKERLQNCIATSDEGETLCGEMHVVYVGDDIMVASRRSTVKEKRLNKKSN